jgi:hypothetical protein
MTTQIMSFVVFPIQPLVSSRYGGFNDRLIITRFFNLYFVINTEEKRSNLTIALPFNKAIRVNF